MVVIHRAERHLGNMSAIAEEDIAMQVAIVGHGSPLVRTERRELAWVIVGVGDLDVLRPDGAGNLRRHEGFDRRLVGERQQVKKYFVLLRFVIWMMENHRLRLWQLADGRARSVRLLCHANVFGVIGYSHKVHWGLDFDVIAHGVLDDLPLRVLEGIVGPGDAVTHDPGIQRPTGVDVLFPEVGIAVGVFLDALFGCGCLRASASLWGGLRLVARNQNADANQDNYETDRCS